MSSSSRAAGLSAKEQAILGVLRAARQPMTAYAILDRVRDAGISAPPTVYRALNKMIGLGLVHRLDSINAFVTCTSAHAEQEPVLFAICDDCGSASEINDKSLAGLLDRQTAAQGFNVSHATLELHGRCGNCAGSGTAETAS